MESTRIRLSRFLSLVLRHDPERAGLALDAAGWVDVDALIAGARRIGVSLDRTTLEQVVRENDKQRFAFSPDGRRIRANQGHSVAVDLGLVPKAPPETLYHGTATRHLAAIWREGLRAGRRTHVHLSDDAATAAAVGRRHGRAVVLDVAAGAMHRAGHVFLRSANAVWLTDAVPPEYLTAL